MEILAIVFALLTIYLGLIQMADILVGSYGAANRAGWWAVTTFTLAIVFGVLAAV